MDIDWLETWTNDPERPMTMINTVSMTHKLTDGLTTIEMRINDPERPLTMVLLFVFFLMQNVIKLWKNKIFSTNFIMNTVVLIRFLLNVMCVINEIVRRITMNIMNNMYCTLNGRRCINLSQLIYMIMMKICNDDIKSSIPCHIPINVSSSAITCDVELRSVKSDTLCFNSVQFDVLVSFCCSITENMHKNHGQGTRQTWEFPFRLVAINRTRPGHPHIKGSVKKKVNKFLSVFTYFKARNESNPDQIIMKITRIILRLSRYMSPYVWQPKLSGKEHESQNIKFKKKSMASHRNIGKIFTLNVRGLNNLYHHYSYAQPDFDHNTMKISTWQSH